MRNKSIKVTLSILLLLTATITIYSIMTYGISHITSDFATSYLLSKSIVENGSLFPLSWNSANGEIWFLSGPLLAFPFNILMANKPLARMIGSVLAVAITSFGMIWFSKHIYKDSSYLLSIPLFVLFVSGDIAVDANLYQVANTLLMFWIVVCPGFLFYIYHGLQKKVSKNNWVRIVLFVIIMVSLLIGGSRYLAEQTLPLILTVLAVTYFQLKKEKVGAVDPGIEAKKEVALLKKNCLNALISTIIIMLPSALGYGISQWLNLSRNLNETNTKELNFAESVSDLFSNGLHAIQNLYIDFGFDGSVSVTSISGLHNIISIIVCTLICIIIPILAYRHFDAETEEGKFYLIYAFWHNLILLTVIICCGKLHERWILTVILVDIIISARYIYRNWILAKDLSRFFWTCSFVLAAFIEMLYMIERSDGWKEQYTNERNVAEQLLERGLTKGYASFWNAFSTEVYSDGQIEFAEAHINEGKIVSSYWLVDNSRFEIIDGPTFLMLSEDEYETFGESILGTFGEEKEMFIIEDAYMYAESNSGNGFDYTNLYVMVFDYDIGSNILNGIHDGIITPNELFFNWYGTRLEDGSFVLSKDGIVQGPYSDIDSGEYLVTFEGANLAAATIGVRTSENEDNLLYLEGIGNTESSVTCKLYVSKRVENAEFIVVNSTDEEVILKDILVEKQ